MKLKPIFGGMAIASLFFVCREMTDDSPRTTRYTFSDSRWKGEKPLRLALVSDFHGGDLRWWGKLLAQRIRAEHVDIVCVAGDHFEPDVNPREAFAFFKALAGKVPVFFASGNHDEGVRDFDVIKEVLRDLGVHVLDNDVAHINLHGQQLEVFGVRDRSIYASYKEWVRTVRERYAEVTQAQAYHLVICHQPEVMLLDQLRCAVALSGHAHGGQWQLPSGRGVFAPGQGLLPKYTRGVYTRKNYHLVMSTGFKVNYVIPRIHNRPELVIVEIKSEV